MNFERINERIPAEEAVPPKHWENWSPGQESELRAKGPSYVFYQYFVYEPHAILGAYELRKGQQAWKVEHRMADFKTIFRVECAQIERDRDAPNGIKILQLTTAARGQLRDKLTAYFGCNADEAEA